MEGVSTAAIEVLFTNLINVLKEEYYLDRGLNGEAQQLQRTLGMIQDYLSDAEKKSITQHAVKFWLRELEAVAFDADNVLDELNYHLLHTKIHKMKIPTPTPTPTPTTKAKEKVLSCFSSCIHLSRPRKMAHTIKQINADFEPMNKRAVNLGLQSIPKDAPTSTAAPSASAETDSFSLDPIFIGRDADVPKLVELLTQTHPQERIFSTVALVGMGGLGKTALTKKVFHHERVKTRFGSLIWVHVSQTFDPISLFNKILSTLTSSHTEVEMSREVILRRLQKALRDKTYLLVLDDLWNEDVLKWGDFINSMAGVTSTKENGILITTRSLKVASIVSSFHIHRLDGLSDDDCWSIIKAKTFDENGEVPSGFEMIGRQIAERCKGLPLAANVVGGVLRSNKSEEEWRFINEKWLSNDEGGEDISKILKLSYDHLSWSSLKKCFAYCSVFPKGQEIVKQKLIELWMGEGFLQPSRRDDMESVGDKFFNILLHKSLLLVAYRDDYGNVESCMMHDLVHDMASSVLSSIQVRYTIHNEASPIPKEEAKNLRTLFLESETSCTMFSDLESLHNLTLSGDSYKELPEWIGELHHLRYLNISKTEIGNLPEWIGELHHLQTLRAYTWNLKELPSTLKYLINLRHLYIREDVKLPAEIGRLICLQTLRHFTAGDEKGYQIEELGSLKNLKGQLEIRSLEKVRDKEEAMKAKIFQKSNLSELVFKWDNWNRQSEHRNDENVLEGLQPHPNLKKLVISGFKGKRFPRWSEKMAVRDGPQGSWVPLDNLIEITLSNCSECEEIPTLGHLPNLKSLRLRELKNVKFIKSSFNSLTSLQIENLEGLECLPDGIFYNNQNLSKLSISGCHVLRELPNGLDTLNSLEELTILNCPNLKFIGYPSGGAGHSQATLRWLCIQRCGGLMELPRQMLESWAPTIEDLSLWGLSSLKNLPVVIDCLAKSSPRLTNLRINGVPKLMAAGSVESWDFGSLKKLGIDFSVGWSSENIVAIKDTVDGILQGCCNSLTELYLTGVENSEWVPQSIQHLTALSHLSLSNMGVEELPQWFGNLSSLTSLSLYSCKKLRCLPSPDAWKRLTQLRWLYLKHCPELRIDYEWHYHPHLTIERE